tara:strand:+ start:304 stop:642 length:339 start_codon:yes stop_codon:yes gene_type:complete
VLPYYTFAVVLIMSACLGDISYCCASSMREGDECAPEIVKSNTRYPSICNGLAPSGSETKSPWRSFGGRKNYVWSGHSLAKVGMMSPSNLLFFDFGEDVSQFVRYKYFYSAA